LNLGLLQGHHRLSAARKASPAPADSPEYPSGLFENSPVIPSRPPDAARQLDDYCADVARRTFRSQAEVKRAHALCDATQSEIPPLVEQPLHDQCMFDALDRLSAGWNAKSVDAAKAACSGLEGR
jgi:hypothetical protein